MRTIVARYCGALLIGISATVVLSAQSGPVNYVYDELGRLVAVIDGTGARAIYIYDAVGNLTSIERYAAGTVSIIDFTPNTGPNGTAVTIYGTGFSSTPSQNTVTFNGVAATVTSSTATQIATTVPATATTGTIAVTTPNGSATSSTAFVVASTMPTITSFTPQIAVTGTAVTINGTNFDPIAANDRVKVNNSFTSPSSASASVISTTVPPQTGSGRITVATPGGTALSADDLFIPPSPFVASDVQVTDRMALGDAKSVSITSSGKIALIVFDGTKNHRISLRMTNVTVTNSSVRIYKPDGVQLAWVSVGTSGGYIDVQTLPTTGTYTILVDPSSTYTGSMTLTLYDVPADVTGTITAGGTAVTVTTTAPGQNATLTFAGTSGQRISLRLTSVTYTSSSDVRIYKPDGVQLTSASVGSSGGFIDTQTLPTTGTYSILVDPSNWATGSMTLTLYDVPADPTGSITPGGAAVTVTTTTAGQNATLTFTGTSGQRISLRLSSVTYTSSSSVRIYKPDGVQLTSASVGSSGGFIDTQTLPTTGTYSILVDPSNWATGSMTLTLYDVPADVTGTLTIGGGAVGVTITTPGQNGSFTFSGTQNQQVTVRITGNTMGSVTVKLLKPDQSQLTSSSSPSASFNLATQTLPTTGTYTVTIDPYQFNTGTLNVSVTSP